MSDLIRQNRESRMILPKADAGALLSRILESDGFNRSPRLSEFLSFVLREELEGRGGRINGTQIAIEIYAKDATFDPKIDPLVRVEARRLRAALDNYYQKEGANDPVYISIPKGGYRPVFLQREQGGLPRRAATTKEVAALPPAPEGPVLAILPFTFTGGSEKGELFGEGISGALTTALTRFDIIQVISQQSSSRYLGEKTDVRVVGRELGARFLLQGKVQIHDAKIRVSVTLAETDRGMELWAENFDRSLDGVELFYLEDELTKTIIGLVTDANGIVSNYSLQAALEKPIEDLSVYEAILWFLLYLNHRRLDDLEPARQAMETSLQKAPMHASLLSGLSLIDADDYLRGISRTPGLPARAMRYANEAVTANSKSASAHLARAVSALINRKQALGIEEARVAIQLNPNHATIVGMAGLVIGMCGEMAEGIGTIRNVMRLNPFYATWLVSLECLDCYMKGENDAVLNLADRFTLNDWPGRPLFRTVALAQSGNTELAASALAELKSIEPDFARDPVAYIERRFLFDDQVSYLLDGLAKAGQLPDSHANPEAARGPA